MKTVAISVFKARCLKLLDEVARTGEQIVVTKRGQPVARVIPERIEAPACRVLDDVVTPIAGEWDVDR